MKLVLSDEKLIVLYQNKLDPKIMDVFGFSFLKKFSLLTYMQD